MHHRARGATAELPADPAQQLVLYRALMGGPLTPDEAAEREQLCGLSPADLVDRYRREVARQARQ